MAQSQRLPRLRVGIDLVLVSRIVRSGQTFGERFQRRVFTDSEIEYARSAPACAYGRLAAKEAAKEALELDGIGWRGIEVRRIARCVRSDAARCGARSGGRMPARAVDES